MKSEIYEDWFVLLNISRYVNKYIPIEILHDRSRSDKMAQAITFLMFCYGMHSSLLFVNLFHVSA